MLDGFSVLIPHVYNHFPWMSIWQNKATLSGFLYLVSHFGKILTFDNLRKWQIIVVDWCCMCKKSRKTVDHLLLHCEIASSL
jgi:hypothetical protein